MKRKVPRVSQVSRVPRESNKLARDTCGTRATHGTLAFTLIELLVVISIIGILIGLSIVALQSARSSGRDAQRRADLELIRSALELYRTDCVRYPVQTLLPPAGRLVGEGGATGGPNCLTTNIYMEKVPQDPLPDVYKYVYVPLPPDQLSYAICAYLENKPEPSSALPECVALFNPGGGCGGGTPGTPGRLCNYVVKNP